MKYYLNDNEDHAITGVDFSKTVEVDWVRKNKKNTGFVENNHATAGSIIIDTENTASGHTLNTLKETAGKANIKYKLNKLNVEIEGIHIVNIGILCTNMNRIQVTYLAKDINFS